MGLTCLARRDPTERDRLTRSPMLTDVEPNRTKRSSSLQRDDASHAAAAASCRHSRSLPPTNACGVRQRMCAGDVTGHAAAVDRVLSAILMAARRSERRPSPRSTPTRSKDSTTAAVAHRGAAKTTTTRSLVDRADEVRLGWTFVTRQQSERIGRERKVTFVFSIDLRAESVSRRGVHETRASWHRLPSNTDYVTHRSTSRYSITPPPFLGHSSKAIRANTPDDKSGCCSLKLPVLFAAGVTRARWSN